MKPFGIRFMDSYRKRKGTALLYSFFVLGFFLRIYKLAYCNMWFDEFMSWSGMRTIGIFLGWLKNSAISLPAFILACGRGVLYGMFRFSEPPLYILMLQIWTMLFGDSLFALRLLSVIFGILAIPLLYRIGKIFFDARTGVLAALILTFSPIHIWYSQEARKYALSVFFILLVIYLLARALQKNKKKYWVGFTICSIVSFYINWLSLLMNVMLGLFLLIPEYRSARRNFAVSTFYVALFVFPSLIGIFQVAKHLTLSFWVPPPTFEAIAITLGNFSLGYNAPFSLYFIMLAVFFTLFIRGIISWRDRQNHLLIFCALVFVPIFSLYSFSQWVAIYTDRQLLVVAPLYYLVVAAGISTIKHLFFRRVIVAAFLVCAGVSLVNYFNHIMPLPSEFHVGVYTKNTDGPVVEFVKENQEQGDIAAIANVDAWRFEYYLPEYSSTTRAYFFMLDSQFKAADRFWYDMAKLFTTEAQQWGFPLINIVNLEDSISEIPETKRIDDIDFKRIWLVSSSWERDSGLAEHVQAVRRWMHEHMRVIKKEQFDGIIVELYVP